MPVISGGGSGSGAITRLSNNVLGADAASIDVTGLSQAGTHLRIEVLARSTRAATNIDNLFLRFNNDSGANYYSEGVIPTGTGALSGSQLLTQTGLAPGCPAATATANLFVAIVFEIPYYTSAQLKSGLWSAGYSKALSTGNIVYDAQGWTWNNTAAITRVTLLAANGNLLAASSMSIYQIT